MAEQGGPRPTLLAERVRAAIAADPELAGQIRRETARALWDRLEQSEARAHGLRDQLAAALARVEGLERERDGWLAERVARQHSAEHDRHMLNHYRQRMWLRRGEWVGLGVVAGVALAVVVPWVAGLVRGWLGAWV